MSHVPTPQQIKVIESTGNCVVIANPGSGKTFTLVQKIKRTLPTLPEYKGVIAISYTNKASDELQERCLAGGIAPKASFFGTIDSFFLQEIIVPFSGRIFGLEMNDIEVVTAKELSEYIECPTQLKIYESVVPETEIGDYMLQLKSLYERKIIVLETFGVLANYIFDVAIAVQKYIHARYTHIIIDEYQDCGYFQHILFRKLVNLGLTGIAVGDINQSIFAFAKRDARYLKSLSEDKEHFEFHSITENHRCHLSIVNYSSRLIASEYLPETVSEDIRVYEKTVQGSEIEIAKWLPSAIEVLCATYDINERRRVAILFRSRYTGQILVPHLHIPFKPSIQTPLENSASLWGNLFRRIVIWAIGKNLTKQELIESYLGSMEIPTSRKIMKCLCRVERIVNKDPQAISQCQDDLVAVAQTLFPNNPNKKAVAALEETISNSYYVDSYIPPAPNEVQIMTLHKSKGLEFDLVFHLSLYKHIMPNPYENDTQQSLNLHYVGITRARKCCVLCTSTQRHRQQDGRYVIVDAERSPFLANLSNLRIPCDF